MTGARRFRFRALQKTKIGSVDPAALKIPARRAECSLTENARSPFHAEPGHAGEVEGVMLQFGRRYKVTNQSVIASQFNESRTELVAEEDDHRIPKDTIILVQ